MIREVCFDTGNILPARPGVLAAMGMRRHHKVSARVEASLDLAFEIFHQKAEPVGIYSPVSRRAFKSVFEGEGLNSGDSPVRDIYLRAETLHLFALTLGKTIVTSINELNENSDYAVSLILNTIASAAADKAAGEMEAVVSSTTGHKDKSSYVLGYSPGYCGWDISGQKKLFEYLDPGRIGITLNSSFLMDPVKSVTGVVIGGPAEIHSFAPGYPFCKSCKTKSCIPRLKLVKENIGSR
jgi:hypothetical protein